MDQTRKWVLFSCQKAEGGVGGMFFRGAELKALASESPGPASPTENLSVDPVLDELRRWDGMGVKEYEKFISTDGLQ